MVVGYLKDECVGFFTEYLQIFEPIQRCMWDEEEEYRDAEEILQGARRPYVLSHELYDVAHQYALSNVALIADFHEWALVSSPQFVFDAHRRECNGSLNCNV